MTTKPKSVLAWAVCEMDGEPIPMACSVSKAFCHGWARSSKRPVQRVRITVVRERKRKATKRRAKR